MADNTNRTDGPPSEPTHSVHGPDRRRFLRYAGAISTVALAGCSRGDRTDEESTNEDSENSSGQSETEDDTGMSDIGAVETSEITAVNVAFEPVLARIEVGGSMTWSIDEGTHTITAYHPDNDMPLRIPEDAEPFNSDLVEEGGTFTHEFDTEGVYDYYCVPHEGDGMIASVIVGEPDPDGDEPGLSEPGNDVLDPETILELNGAAIEELGGTPPGMGDDSTDESDEEAASDEESEENDGSTAATAVSIPGREFSPDLVQVATGGTVRWTFEDDAHTVTAYEDRIPASADPFDSGFKQEGDVFEVTFDETGVYDYYCTPHTGHGMVGTVIVGDPDPDSDELGLSEPVQDGDEGAALESLNARTRDQLAGDNSDYETINAETLDDADGEIDIEVQAEDGTVGSGDRELIVARYERTRLTNAPVDVEGDFQGYTDGDGEFRIAIPQDLEPDDECRIEIRVDGARGRVEVPIEG